MRSGTGADGPMITRINFRIGTLERRIDHLQKRLIEGRSGAQQSYDEAEIGALQAAISALRYHRASLEAETDPVLVLSELLDASAPAMVGNKAFVADVERLEAARTRAARALRDLSQD